VKWKHSHRTPNRTEPNLTGPSLTERVRCLVFLILLASRRPILLRNRSDFHGLKCVLLYNEHKYVGLRSFNQCGAFKTGFMGTSDKNYQNRDLKLKLWEEVAAECDSSCKKK
jgi:hypothetical protein